MGELIRSIDWSKTPLGSPETWPLALKMHTRTMLDNKVGMYIAWGPEYTQLYNDAYRPILGSVKHPRAMGISTRETFVEIWDIIGSMFSDVMHGKSVGFPDFMLPLERNGFVEECYFDFSYSPIYHEDGFVGGVLVTVIETTEQVFSKRRVEESEANMSRLIMSAPVAMCVLKEPEYIVEIANQPMLELWGTTLEAVLKKPIFEGLPEAKNQGLEALLEEVYKTGVTFSAQERPVVLKRNGKLKTVYINFTYDPFIDQNGKITGIIAVAIDVTEQVESRHNVEELEERARLAIQSANLGTYDIDLKTNAMVTSDRFDEIYEVAKGSDRQEYVKKYHPDDREIRDKGMEEALKKGATTFQVRIVLKDQSVKWIRCNSIVFYNPENVPVRLLGTVLDITDMMNMQRHKDDFIAIASHELKTPLTSIKAYNQILSSLIKSGDEVTSLNIIKKTERQIHKMIKLIHNFLDLSKVESAQLKLEIEEFDINELISETINYHNLPENKERLRFNKGELPPVKADKSKIAHVIDNVLSNALKYSPIHEKVLIRSEMENDSIVISVEDHGKGINDSSKEKIFQRFYRAENTMGGTTSGFGIGLYFAFEIIKLHRGLMWFDSEEGKGSTFYFSLPV